MTDQTINKITDMLGDIRTRLSVYENSFKFLSTSLENVDKRLVDIEGRVQSLDLSNAKLMSWDNDFKRLYKDFRTLEETVAINKETITARLNEISHTMQKNTTVSNLTTKIGYLIIGATVSGFIALFFKQLAL
jgi:uncharacterized phage infection (PIP) family protein YhgE